MQLNRIEAIKALIEPESINMHGLSASEIWRLSTVKLAEIINKVFEPIDLDDPYTVIDYDTKNLN